MKKSITILFYFFTLIFPSIIFGQTAKSEKYISEAAQEIKEKKYLASMNNLEKGREELNILLGKELAKALPQKSGEWELYYSPEIEENAFNNMLINPNRFAMVRAYSKGGEPKKESAIKDSVIAESTTPETIAQRSPDSIYTAPLLTVSICNCIEYFGAVDRAYLADDDPMKAMQVPVPTQLSIKGNRAFLKYDQKTKSGDFMVNIGNGVVRIAGEGITNPDVFKTLAEAIDYNILKLNLH